MFKMMMMQWLFISNRDVDDYTAEIYSKIGKGLSRERWLRIMSGGGL